MSYSLYATKKSLNFTKNTNIKINAKIAQMYGTDVATLLSYLAGWIKHNREHKQNIINNRCWTFDSLDKMLKKFTIWGRSKLYRVIQKAKRAGLIIISKFNKRKDDRTNWYAFSDECDKLFSGVSAPPNTKNYQTHRKRSNTQVDDLNHISISERACFTFETALPDPLTTKEINITNNSSNTEISEAVVCDFENVKEEHERELEKLRQEKEALENLDVEEGKKLNDIGEDHQKRYKYMQYLGHIRGKISDKEREIAKKEQDMRNLKAKHAKEASIIGQIDHVLNKPGDRAVEPHLFSKICRTLAMKHKGQELIKHVNEVVHEVRFGTLSKKSLKGKDLTVEHAVNIALKLVKENRWQTPTAFVEAI
jgi:hypothetical protein